MVSSTFAIGVPSGAAHVQIALQLAIGVAGQEHRHALVIVHIPSPIGLPYSTSE